MECQEGVHGVEAGHIKSSDVLYNTVLIYSMYYILAFGTNIKKPHIALSLFKVELIQRHAYIF